MITLLTAQQALDLLNAKSTDLSHNTYVSNYHIWASVNDKLTEIAVNPKKSSIEKTMYYDDTLSTPDTDFDSFVNYNKDNQTSIDSSKEHIIYCNHYKQLYYSCTEKTYDHDYARFFNLSEDISKEDQTELVKIIEGIQHQYLERLKKYFNKYSDKISTSGYWANR